MPIILQRKKKIYEKEGHTRTVFFGTVCRWVYVRLIEIYFENKTIPNEFRVCASSRRALGNKSVCDFLERQRLGARLLKAQKIRISTEQKL